MHWHIIPLSLTTKMKDENNLGQINPKPGVDTCKVTPKHKYLPTHLEINIHIWNKWELETISKHNRCPSAESAYCKGKARYIKMCRRNVWMTHLCCCRFCHLEMCIFSWSPRGWCHTGIHIYLHANQPHSNSFHSNTFHGLNPKQILYSEKVASF